MMTTQPPTHPSNNPAANLAELFTFHPATTKQRGAYAEIRNLGLDFATAIAEHCPPCADTTAAIRKVREAVMTANAAIALAPPAAEQGDSPANV